MSENYLWPLSFSRPGVSASRFPADLSLQSLSLAPSLRERRHLPLFLGGLCPTGLQWRLAPRGFPCFRPGLSSPLHGVIQIGFCFSCCPPLFLIACRIWFVSAKFYLVSLVRTLRALRIPIMSSSAVTLLVLHRPNWIKMSAFLYKSLIKMLCQRGLNTKSYGTTTETSFKLTLFH